MTTSVTGLESVQPCLRQPTPAVKAITRMASAPALLRWTRSEPNRASRAPPVRSANRRAGLGLGGPGRTVSNAPQASPPTTATRTFTQHLNRYSYTDNTCLKRSVHDEEDEVRLGVEGDAEEDGEAGDCEHVVHAGCSDYQGGDTLHVPCHVMSV